MMLHPILEKNTKYNQCFSLLKGLFKIFENNSKMAF